MMAKIAVPLAAWICSFQGLDLATALVTDSHAVNIENQKAKWADENFFQSQAGESVMFTFWLAPENGVDVMNERGIWVISYETNISDAPLGSVFVDQLNQQMQGLVHPKILGQGTTFNGFSAKHQLAIRMLRRLNPKDLVILCDYADVLLNFGGDRGPMNLRTGDAIRHYKDSISDLLEGKNPDAVVISAEPQCCVGALSYVKPGELVSTNGTRLKRACASGSHGCLGKDSEQIRIWKAFMNGLASQRGFKGEANRGGAAMLKGLTAAVISQMEATPTKSLKKEFGMAMYRSTPEKVEMAAEAQALPWDSLKGSTSHRGPIMSDLEIRNALLRHCRETLII